MPMPEPRDPPDSGAESRDSPAAQPAPVPDEDGPHDVPDDKVIEKTLPTEPVGEGIGEASA